jgi:hypothetical protein
MWALNTFFFFVILIGLRTGQFLPTFLSLIVYIILLTIWENEIRETD